MLRPDREVAHFMNWAKETEKSCPLHEVDNEKSLHFTDGEAISLSVLAYIYLYRHYIYSTSSRVTNNYV